MAENQCYTKVVQNHSVGQLTGFGAATYYWKKGSNKKTKYRGLKTFGLYLVGNIIGHNVMNIVNTPPPNCTIKTAFGLDSKTTSNSITDSPTGSPPLAGCRSCRDRF